VTLQQLRYIAALDRHRHFGKAADECLVTQPTLTMQLRKLEEEMGVVLFDRSRQPIVPTPAGTIILAKSREILQHAEQLYHFVRGEHTSVKGTFTVGIIPTLAPYLLSRFIPKFLVDYPETKLVIREIQTERIIEQLKNGTIDIGILVTPLNEATIREVPLFSEPFEIYTRDASIGNELTIEQLPTEGLMLLEEGHCFRSQALELCGRREQSGIHNLDYRSGSIESLKALVRRGLGYTLIPALSATDEDAPYRRQFQTPAPVREVSLVVHQSFVREQLLEVLRETIRAAVPQAYLDDSTYYKVRWRQI
jgi:LysR family hydrogen peroxide-inducible transcriptional activator